MVRSVAQSAIGVADCGTVSHHGTCDLNSPSTQPFWLMCKRLVEILWVLSHQAMNGNKNTGLRNLKVQCEGNGEGW